MIFTSMEPIDCRDEYFSQFDSAYESGMDSLWNSMGMDWEHTDDDQYEVITFSDKVDPSKRDLSSDKSRNIDRNAHLRITPLA